MFGLNYFFYPWGYILQILALVHAVRRRPEYYWYLIILMGGMLGAVAYILIEVLPDAGLARDAFVGLGRKSRIRTVETTILDNPSAANYEELGDLLFDEGSIPSLLRHMTSRFRCAAIPSMRFTEERNAH